jgi:SAM-dependent methyltransferase
VHRQLAADGRGRHRARAQERPREPHLQAGRHRAGPPARRIGRPRDPQPGAPPRAPPQKAVDEAHRILRPGGQLLILELAEHDFEKARELYADLWLGFKESALDGFLKKAKFIKVEVTPVSKEAVEPFFQTLLASGTKA